MSDWRDRTFEDIYRSPFGFFKLFAPIVFFIFAVGLLLASCGDSLRDPPEDVQPVGGSLWVREVTTPNNVVVECIVLDDSSRAGLSCDWGGASRRR